MEIKILGTGCSNCRNLEKAVIKCITELNIIADVEKVEDIQKIISYGIIRTPGLIINGAIALSGRIPTQNELKEIILKYT